MTCEQKQQIIDLRSREKSWTEIGEAMSLPRSTVKSFYRRSVAVPPELTGTRKPGMCGYCHKVLENPGRTKPRQFCDPTCRNAYWNARRVGPRGLYPVNCGHCGRFFMAWNKGQKYCGHPCYIAHRFGELPGTAAGSV